MAEAVKIANLQIEISDNSQTVTASLKEFVKTLTALRSATDKGAGISKIATGINNVNKAVEKGGLGGLTALAESLANAVSPAENLANALERVAQANRAIKQSGDLRIAVRQATKLQEKTTPKITEPSETMPTGMVNKGKMNVDDSLTSTRKSLDVVDDALRTTQGQASSVDDVFQVMLKHVSELQNEVAQSASKWADETIRVVQETKAAEERLARARNILAQMQMRDDLTQSISQWVSETTHASEAMIELQSRMRSARETLVTIQMRDDLARGVDDVVAKFTKAPTAMQKFANAMKPVGEAFKTVGQYGKNFFHTIIPQGISNLIRQFSRLAKMKVLRTIISNLMKGFSEGLKNAYNWARMTGDQFATSMNTIATSMNYAKNTIGAAFATVLNAVAPVIDRLVDWLVTGINYINMFFSALGGSTTYVRAKKVATVYDDTLDNVKNGASGATGAIKELEEELSVLDFDELNQLADQQDASYGRSPGGGGSSGKATPDYANMFERVDIDSKIKNIADFFRNNFETILDLVKAIGAGILAWKFANTFLDGLSTLKKLGVAMMVGGLVLEAEGAYDMGKNGISLKNVLETAGGALAAIVGGVFTFGATSLLITVPLTIVTFIASFLLGAKDGVIEDFKNDPKYKELIAKRDAALEELETVKELRVTIKSIVMEYDEKQTKIKAAQKLIDKLKSYEGIENPTASQLSDIQTIVDAINSLNLEGITASFELFNGQVKTNAEELQKSLDLLKEIALQQLYADLLAQQMLAEVKLESQRQGLSQALWDYNGVYKENMDIIDEAKKTPGRYVSRAWQPGDEVPLAQFSDPEVAKAMLAINTQLETIQAYADGAGEAKLALEDINRQIDILNEKTISENVYPSIPKLTQARDTIMQINGYYVNDWLGKDKIPVQEPQQWYAGMSMSQTNTPQTLPPTLPSVTPTLSVPSNGLLQINGVEWNKYSNGANSATTATKGYTSASQQAYTVSQMQDAANAALAAGYYSVADAIRTGGADAQQYTKWVYDNLDVTQKQATVVSDASRMYPVYASAMTNAGNAAEKSAGQTDMINTALSQVGMNVSYAGIANAISTNLGSQNFKGMGDARIKNPIEGQVNLIGAGVSASTIYNKVGNLIGAQPFSKIGTSAKGNIEGQMNMTGSGVNANTIYGTVSKKTEAQPWANIGRGMAQQMAMGLEGATATMRYVMDAVYNGMVNSLYRTPWSSIGQYIGYEIKNGLRQIIGSFDFTVQVKANGRSYNVGGSARAYFAQGGYPQAGTVFVAGEAGAEAVGTIGGKTGVANRDQIASAIAQALKPMLGSGGGRTETIEVNTYLDSAIIAKANAKGQVALKKQFNMRSNA